MRTGRKRKADRAAVLRLSVAVLALVGLGFLLGVLVPRPDASAAVSRPMEPVSVQTHTPPSTEVSAEATPEPTPGFCLSASERDLVERVVMAEAGGEDYDGQALVAQCILNTAEARDMRPDAVVLEEKQYAVPADSATLEVQEAVSAVFDDGYTVTDEPARFFYAPKYCYSSWHENKLEFVLEHGGHRFFKEAGA